MKPLVEKHCASEGGGPTLRRTHLNFTRAEKSPHGHLSLYVLLYKQAIRW
jgi:hypothetical protein